MIKESKPIRTQEKQSSDQSQAAAEFPSKDGSSLPAPSYKPHGGTGSGAGYVQQLQASLGTSLKGTKVVKNSPKANAIGEKAFAEGNKIHFAPGAYQPDTKSGQEMIGHEVMHTVQQRKGRVQSQGQVGDTAYNNDPQLERQATTEASRASKGEAVNSSLQNVQGEASNPVAQGFLGKVFNSVKKGVSSAGNFLKKGVSGTKNLASSAFKIGKGVLGKGVDAVKNIGKTGLGFAKNAVGFGGRIFGAAKGLAKNVAKTGLGFAKKAWGAAKNVIDKVKQSGGILKDAISGGMSWIKSKVEKGVDAVEAIGGYVKKKVKGFGSKVLNGIKKAVSDPVGAIKDVVEGVVSKGSSAWSWLKETGGHVVKKAKGILKKIKKLGSKGLDHLKSVGQGVWGVLSSVGGGVVSGLKNIFSGNFVDGLKDMGMGVVNGIAGGISTFLDGTVGLFDRFGGPEGTEVSASEIPSRHVMDEFTAHRIAYKDAAGLMNGSALSPKEVEILENGGYDPDNIMVRTGPNGFQAVLIMPADDDVAPMLAIRGTADMAGAMTDADPAQVGDYQYKNNRETIQEMLDAAGGNVDLSGHSLGGAMAQIIAANHTGNVNRVTTFQSPGISAESAQKFNDNVANMSEEDRPEVAHHIVKNDLVSKAGEENLPGSIYEHDLGNINPIEAHTSFVSATEDFQSARDEFGISDSYMENEVGKEIRDDSAIMKFDEQPYKYQRLVAEFVRSGVGSVRDAVASGWNKVKGFGNNIFKKGSATLSRGKKLVEGLFKTAKKKGKRALKKFRGLFNRILG